MTNDRIRLQLRVIETVFRAEAGRRQRAAPDAFRDGAWEAFLERCQALMAQARLETGADDDGLADDFMRLEALLQ